MSREEQRARYAALMGEIGAIVEGSDTAKALKLVCALQALALYSGHSDLVKYPYEPERLNSAGEPPLFSALLDEVKRALLTLPESFPFQEPEEQSEEARDAASLIFEAVDLARALQQRLEESSVLLAPLTGGIERLEYEAE